MLLRGSIVPHLTVYAMPIDVIMKPDRYATSISLMPVASLAAASSPPLFAAVRELRKSMAHWSTVFIVRLAFDESSVLGSRFWSSDSRSLVWRSGKKSMGTREIGPSRPAGANVPTECMGRDEGWV